jgi:hypothetical protein
VAGACAMVATGVVVRSVSASRTVLQRSIVASPGNCRASFTRPKGRRFDKDQRNLAALQP